MDDATLLNKFTADHCDDAFAELVKRYVDLVWSAARRQTNDADLAEDVTQSVFITFAQKARSIRQGESLGGWLLVTTRYTALNAIRTKARRTHHEREAAAMIREQKNGVEPTWDSVSPLLDDAVAKLKREDRDALALRFFQGRSIADVGAAMGISTEAAQKRVTRAVGRLRAIFAARGLATNEDALGSLLTANAVHCAPALLKSAIAAHALTSTAATSSIATSKGVLTLMAATHTKLVAAGVIAVLFLGITGTIAYQTFATPSGHGRQIKIDPAAQTAAPTARPNAPVAPPMPESQWLPHFTEVYALTPKQTVKFVPRPFIPERTGFYRKTSGESQYQSILSGPDIMLVEYDGADLSESGETFGGTPNVIDAAHYVLGISSWDLFGADRLLHLRMPGDWVVRKGSTREQRTADFLTEVSKANNGPLMLESRQAPRQCVVIRGKLDMHPLMPREPNGGPPLVFYRGTIDLKRASYSGGGLTDRISEFCTMPVIDEANVGRTRFEVHVDPRVWNGAKPTSPKYQQRVDELLANMAKQTSLDFKVETRVLPLWTLAPAPTAALNTH